MDHKDIRFVFRPGNRMGKTEWEMKIKKWKNRDNIRCVLTKDWN